ncbi:DNA polymerase delta subunit [Lachnellula suecica]|uniref:DNA polymerase delta subunit 3 n=1 Tax=Lachnellula suecica TaxID=602035 RepID=A0A8T9C2R3_9HELO|nr:DNA polymerase delta subunit [Lachnellula suecica]
MADYKSYLAASTLTEDKTVTYRLLSRALKVHVNSAKEMLYDFHNQQNAKKPGSVHATYLVSGTKRPEDRLATNGRVKRDGEDDYMQSSPLMSSSMPQPVEDTGETSVLSITLVREEELESLRSQYEQITSIHIYSLEPHPLKDLQILSDVTPNTSNDEQPKTTTIAAAIPAKVQPAKPKPADTKEAPKPSKPVKEEPKSSTANDFFGKSKAKAKPAATSNSSSKESTPNPPTLKKESSSLFKSFAKAKPKKPKAEDSESPALSAAEDAPMKDVSDDEEETYVPPPPSKEIVDKDRKSRKEREAALKKMMDDEEEEESVATPAAEEPEVEEPVEEPEVKEEAVQKEETPVASGGRRRGRRRVLKKKTVTDADGFLVTTEEQGWESFSEDEPAPPPPKRVQSSSTTAKAKKPAGKAGQGSIMSFFGKK